MPASSEQKGKKKNSLWLNLFYIAAIALVMAYLLLRDENLSEVSEALRGLSPAWLGGALFCSLAFLAVEGGAVFFTIRWLCPQTRIGYFKSLKTALVGQFYSAITPSSTGGQPMQVVDMYQNGLSVGQGTSVVAVRFVTHQLSIFLFTFAGFVTQYGFIKNAMVSFIPLGVLGIALSLGAVTLVIGATLCTNVTRAVFSWLVRTLTRLHLCRNPQKLQAQLDDILTDFSSAGAHLIHHAGQLAVLTAFDALFYFLMFSVTFCLYRAFGLSEFSFWKVVLLQAFMYSTIYFFPLPGASGASEGGFLLLFRRVFTSRLVFSSMLLWRLLTYYNKIIVGAGAIVWDALAKAFASRKTGRAQPSSCDAKSQMQDKDAE